jgi:NAD(P)H-quinone oxidoreductase subunit 5
MTRGTPNKSPDSFNVLCFSCICVRVIEESLMVEMVLVVGALTATVIAAISGAVVGRWSPDLASRFAASLTTAGWIAAICLALLRLVAPLTDGAPGVGLPGLTVDWLAVLMLMLVLGLSALIQFFAVRYLRGDSRQVWFVVTANLVTAATAVMVCTNTVFGFGLAWVAAGVSLVALLATYSHLPQARDGVRRTAIRFAIGDLIFMVAVTLLLVMVGGDVPFTDLGTRVAGLPTPLATVIAILLVIPALARSSQVPFHGWLPATLAAPTPVSALMHAGVVNAGAILILRFSPAIGESVAAMTVVFCAGAVTLAFASAVRLIKPDVKGRLVFSTMAQMGFMMLACGMGAFAAAVFHLIAHGLFKSTLFLGAGSGVAREARQRAWPAQRVTHWPQAIASIAVAVTVPAGAILTARLLLGIELSPASQALQLFVVFTAAVALGTTLWAHFSATTAILGGLGITGLTFGYTALINVFDTVLKFGPAPAAVNPWWLLIPGAVLLVLQLVQRPRSGNRASRHLYALTLAAGTPIAGTKRRPIAVPEGALS